jgi:hypothetical protein
MKRKLTKVSKEPNCILTLVDTNREYSEEDEPLEVLCAIDEPEYLGTLEQAKIARARVAKAYPDCIYKIYQEVKL